MRISTIIILAVATMALATFGSPRDCRHACRMDANGVAVAGIGGTARTPIIVALDGLKMLRADSGSYLQ